MVKTSPFDGKLRAKSAQLSRSLAIVNQLDNHLCFVPRHSFKMFEVPSCSQVLNAIKSCCKSLWIFVPWLLGEKHRLYRCVALPPEVLLGSVWIPHAPCEWDDPRLSENNRLGFVSGFISRVPMSLIPDTIIQLACRQQIKQSSQQSYLWLCTIVWSCANYQRQTILQTHALLFILRCQFGGKSTKCRQVRAWCMR